MSSSLSPDHAEGSTSRASTEGTDKGVLSSLNLNFFKSLSDKKVTRSKQSRTRHNPGGMCEQDWPTDDDFSRLQNSWESAQATWTKAGQQACPDQAAGAQPTGSAVSICSRPAG